MRTGYLLTFIIAISFSLSVNAQKSDKTFKPFYVTVTRLHSGTDSVIDLARWKEVEQEFFDKVTKKNRHIYRHEFLVNYFKNGPADVMLIKIFKNWDDIQLAHKMDEKLIKEAWPDKSVRQVFFEEQNKYYDYYYANEIFISGQLTKFRTKGQIKSETEPLIFYVLNEKLANYDLEDSVDAYQAYVENVTNNNPFIKSYLALHHFVGPDSRDYKEIYVIDSFDDLQKTFDKDNELLSEMIPDERERKEFVDIYNRAIEKVSAKIYRNIPSMSK